MPSAYVKRIRQIQRQLAKEDGPTALLLGSAPRVGRSRDQDFSYSPDADFFYVTGINQPDFVVLISNTTRTPLLFTKKVDPVKVLWDGAPMKGSKLADSINAELIISNSVNSEVKKRLRGISSLYFQNIPGSLAWQVTSELMAVPSHERNILPSHFHHSDSLLETMRLHKDKDEIEHIRRACRISFEAIRSTLPLFCHGTKECDLAAALEYHYKLADGDTAFPSIVACGRNAATLHHRASNSLLKRGEMTLFDWGASYKGYASDITRVFPVSGTFTPLQVEIYEMVLAAQKAALKKVRHGVRIRSVYDAAAKVITEGLVDLKVLRGKVSSLITKKAYRPFFPHGIGHSVGLDIHDIGNLRGNNDAKLEKGMVFTIEPGVYLKRKVGKVPACGVRIEDTVLVTRSGAEILTTDVPKSIPDVEALLTY